MKYGIAAVVFAFALVVLALAGTANATPIPGSINEIVNGDFATGVFTPWTPGSGMAIVPDGPGHGNAAVCTSPFLDESLRQIVDETLNPLWDANFHQKVIDLQADIRVSWTPGDAGHPTSDIKFRLDWWNESHNGDTLGQLPVAPDAVSPWVTYAFDTDDGNGIWKTVNPVNQDATILSIDGHPIQPRWVSVEVLIDQKDGEVVWVDNVVLTSKCVNGIPEPMSIMLGCMGLGSIAGLRRLRRG